MNSITFVRYLRYILLNKTTLKDHILFCLIFLTYWPLHAQNFHLEIKGSNTSETQIIDSVTYNSSHKNIASIQKEIDLLSERLKKIGYLENQYDSVVKKNDSLYFTRFNLNSQTKYIHIYVEKNSFLKQHLKTLEKNDTLKVKLSTLEPLIKQTLERLQKSGYPLAKIQLTNINKKGSKLTAKIEEQLNKKRVINTIVVKSSNSETDPSLLPKNYLFQIKKKFRDKPFQQESIKNITEEFQKLPFVSIIKPCEVLFSTDSSVVYVFIEKRKNNYFDGFIGFNNTNENKIQLNGYLDLKLQNLIKRGEEFYLTWRNDGNNQTIFKTGLTLSYLFKTPIGLKGQLDIFKQDSTFQNTKSNIDIQWKTTLNSGYYLGYEATTSNNIQSTQSSITDFKNQFITFGYHHYKKDNIHPIFPFQTNINLRLGLGNRSNNTSKSKKENQTYIQLNLFHTLYFNEKHSLNLKNENYLLNSPSYFNSELHRFGGQQNIRGIAENSLAASYVSTLATEYRFHFNKNTFIHSILDFGIYKNDSSILGNQKKFNNLLSLGLGTGLVTKNGFFTISIANNTIFKKNNSTINTIINISYNVNF